MSESETRQQIDRLGYEQFGLRKGVAWAIYDAEPFEIARLDEHMDLFVSVVEGFPHDIKRPGQGFLAVIRLNIPDPKNPNLEFNRFWGDRLGWADIAVSDNKGFMDGFILGALAAGEALADRNSDKSSPES